ncbi:MAG: FkbM family methyltransferase [Gemmatimonadetes bacterium]|nr:FkbM family methyltransferase [Gemmatimonadota bacterium]
MRGWLGVARSLAVYWRPGRQRGLRRLYGEFVGPGDLVFDVGAHVGDRTAAFATLGARVIALEPQPAVLPWLRRRVGRHPGVTILEEAVGRAVGTATLAVSSAHPTVSTLAEDWRRDLSDRNPSFAGVRWDAAVEVPVTTLDLLIETYGVPRFCKIDVEGHEAEVLAGLSRPVPALSVEFVAGTFEVTRSCVARLAELGSYEYNVILGERRRFVFDRWRTGADLEIWFDGGADGASSGDVYARLRRP